MGTSITAHYGIKGCVPFADVDVDCDNRKHLDAHAIRLLGSPQPFAQDAIHSLDSFFDTISRGAMSSNIADRNHAQDLLKQFEEPWETRLGMAKSGFAGHGGAEDVGACIWESMNTDLEALLRVGILKHTEELPLFVKGIGHDITSDITTRIVFGPLADFTSEMVSQFPEFTAAPHEVREFHRQVWDANNRRWVKNPLLLPVVNDKPLILMPAQWVRPTLLMNAGRFYKTSVLSYAQDEQAAILPNGKLLKTPKDRLCMQQGLARSRETIRTVTLRAQSDGTDLIEIFRQFIADKYRPAA